MKDSFADIRNSAREALLQSLWDQWIALGVAGGGHFRKVEFIIDPEAILLATTRFASQEPRLLEEVLDWLMLNGGLISIHRLKSFQQQTSLGDAVLLEEIASRLVSDGHLGWKALLHHPAKHPDDGGSAGKEILATCTPRGMTHLPSPLEPANFLFRMRALFGVNARPEVLTWLMCHERGYPAEIARQTGWFSKSVQALLNDLERSGLVHSQPGVRRKHFWLDHQAWNSFLLAPGKELIWFCQTPWYEGCRLVLDTVDRLAASPDASESLKAIWIREALPGLESTFQAAGMWSFWTGMTDLKGSAMIEAFRDRVIKWQSVVQRMYGDSIT